MIAMTPETKEMIVTEETEMIEGMVVTIAAVGTKRVIPEIENQMTKRMTERIAMIPEIKKMIAEIPEIESQKRRRTMSLYHLKLPTSKHNLFNNRSNLKQLSHSLQHLQSLPSNKTLQKK